MKTALALSLLVAGCGATTFAESQTVILVPDACTTQGAGSQILQDAANIWNDQGAHFTLSPVEGGKTLPVTCQALGSTANGKTAGEYDSENAQLVLDTGFWGFMAWGATASQFDRSVAVDLVVHELGHSLGLVHIVDPASVMYFQLQPGTAGVLTAFDLDDLHCAQSGEDCLTMGIDNAHPF